MKKFIFIFSIIIIKNVFLLFEIHFFYILLEILLIMMLIKILFIMKTINTDDLTGIYNRRYFFNILKKEIEKSKRRDNYLSFCMFDIDNFKYINDKFGHHTGDIILKELTNIIYNDVREYDTFARLGGEEFALLIENNDKNYAYTICERVRNKIENTNFYNNINVTISIGIANYENGDNIDSIYEKADEAMYKSKINGKNTITLCGSVINACL